MKEEQKEKERERERIKRYKDGQQQQSSTLPDYKLCVLRKAAKSSFFSGPTTIGPIKIKL